MGQVRLPVVHHIVSDQPLICDKISTISIRSHMNFPLTLMNSCCSVNIGTNDLRSGQSPQLTVYSAGHSMQVFVNGKSYGTGT